MTVEQMQVKEFMIEAGQGCPDKPVMPSLEVRKLRVKLIAEELIELAEAFNLLLSISYAGLASDEPKISISENGLGEPDLVSAVDATTDLRVVVIGADVAMGVDGEPCWDEVHFSNMSKFIDGHRREDGKWMKGKSFSPPDIAGVIHKQLK